MFEERMSWQVAFEKTHREEIDLGRDPIKCKCYICISYINDKLLEASNEDERRMDLVILKQVLNGIDEDDEQVIIDILKKGKE